MSDSKDDNNSFEKLSPCFKLSTGAMIVSLHQAALDEVKSKHNSIAGFNADIGVKNTGVDDSANTFVQNNANQYDVGVVLQLQLENPNKIGVDATSVKSKNEQIRQQASKDAYDILHTYFQKFLSSSQIALNDDFRGHDNLVEFVPQQDDGKFFIENQIIKNCNKNAFIKSMQKKLKNLSATEDKLKFFVGFKYPYTIIIGNE